MRPRSDDFASREDFKSVVTTVVLAIAMIVLIVVGVVSLFGWSAILAMLAGSGLAMIFIFVLAGISKIWNWILDKIYDRYAK